jgi:hypothetical protein
LLPSVINLPPDSTNHNNLQKAISDVNKEDDIVFDPFCNAVKVHFSDVFYGGAKAKAAAKRTLGIACRLHLLPLLGLGRAPAVEGQNGVVTSFDFNSGHHCFLVDNQPPGPSFYGYCSQTQRHMKSTRDPTWILQFVSCA